MEVSEMLETLIGELTAQQFITLLCAFVLTIALIFMIAAAIGELVAHLIKGLVYVFRKDKYKSRDFTVTRAYKHLAILRRQFKSASTYTEYILFYNRLTAAFFAYVEIGLIPYEYFLKIVDVCTDYIKKERESKANAKDIQESKFEEDGSKVDTDQ